jgi:hypothetical protein
MGCLVHDSSGQVIGHVHDLRLEAVRVPDAGDDVQYRLTGLQCGSAPVGHRLGYGHGDMAGPWPLVVWFRGARRRSILVQWRDVARFDPPHIHLSRARAELTASDEAHR